MEISQGHVGQTQVTTMRNGRVSGLLIDGALHVLGASSSSYRVSVPGGFSRSYICQDGCCDAGLRPDVAALVAAAKEIGATRVVLRWGVPEIAGLPVEDAADYVGSPVDGVLIHRR